MSRMLTFLIIGVAVGILIAPEKGSITRGRLADLFSDLSDEAEDFVGKVSGTVKDTAGDLGVR